MSREGISSLLRLASAIGLFFIGSYLLRGLGRFSNLDYISFIHKYVEMNKLKRRSAASKPAKSADADADDATSYAELTNRRVKTIQIVTLNSSH